MDPAVLILPRQGKEAERGSAPPGAGWEAQGSSEGKFHISPALVANRTVLI